VAELGDGSLYLNMRSYHGANRRAVARSLDGGLTWADVELDDALVEPICQAGLVGHGAEGEEWLLFSNPASTTREAMTVRLSRDGGRIWPWLGMGRFAVSTNAAARARTSAYPWLGSA
jgi:sialidase-1